MKFFLMAAATVLLGLFSIAALVVDFHDPKVAAEARAAGAGLFISSLLLFVTSHMNNRDAERITAERHEKLLRGVLREGQRVSPDRIRVAVSHRCFDSAFPRSQRTPKFLNSLWEVTLSVYSSKTTVIDFPFNTWSAEPLININETPGARLRVRSRTISSRTSTYNGVEFGSEDLSFSDFVGSYMEFDDGENWNGAFVEVHLQAMRQHEGLSEWVKEEYGENTSRSEQEGRDEQRRLMEACYVIKEEESPLYYPRAIPILFDAEVFVGTRSIGSSTGMLALSYDSYDTDRVVVKFPFFQVEPNQFPGLATLPPQSRLDRATDVLLTIVVGSLLFADVTFLLKLVHWWPW